MDTQVFERISLELDSTILFALKKMDLSNSKLLIVVEKGHFKSLLSIGDIQRAIIANVPLTNTICCILRPQVKVASVHDDMELVKKNMYERRNEFMPVVDDAFHVVDVIFWKDLFKTEQPYVKQALNLPVVIMAGGQGTRLKPLTNVLPKPLIPIGEQTMIEDIMDNFVNYGCHDFLVSVNYKAELIKHYLELRNNPLYHLSYFQEEKPLGTAGSLFLLKDRIKTTFFVSNCDIIVNDDYAEILSYHRHNKNEITIVAAVKSYDIAYGTLETGMDGLLKNIHEKPELTFKINTGMYVIEPHLLAEIPQNEFYHITYLIDKLVKEDRKVGVYPISEGSWTDVGNWEEYMKCIK